MLVRREARVLDYIWAGLPVVCTKGDAVAEIVETYDLGVTVSPSSLNDLVQAIRHLSGEVRPKERRAEGFASARKVLGWSRVVGPLVQLTRLDSLLWLNSVTS
jgi:glycosyltransferase involved in cell wall biosynthesis